MTWYVLTEHFNSAGSQKGLAAVAPLFNCTWLVIEGSRCTGYVAVLGIRNLHKHSLQGKKPQIIQGDSSTGKKTPQLF